MSVQNAGTAIRKARLAAGLTQEKLSEGVCSVLSLSRIENSSAGVSPATFQALMAGAGAPTEAFPAFANRADFDCFYNLKRASFYLDSWQLTAACEELEKTEARNWAGNKFYYQEWLYLHGRLQFRSGCGSHEHICRLLLAAMHVTRPDFVCPDISSLLLSVTEIRILTLLAQELLALGQTDSCASLCTQLTSYLSDTHILYLEKDRLLAELSIVSGKYLLAAGKYSAALECAEAHRQKMMQNMTDAPLFELTFLTGLCHHLIGSETDALSLFQTAFYAAHSIESCYATTCKHCLETELQLVLPVDTDLFPDIPLVPYEQKQAADGVTLGDGTYDLFAPDALSLGRLIRDLRTEQKIPQARLCLGLCSKSKLSKIENETLWPDVLLAETLLERLGISSDIFTFFGDKREAALFELRTRMIRIRKSEYAHMPACISEMSNLITEKDTLYWQYLCFEKALLIDNPIDKMAELEHVLSITLPDFRLYTLSDYCLSRTELTVLNNLCNTCAENNPVTGIQYFYKNLEYQTHSGIDILLLKNALPVTVSMLTRRLYAQKRPAEILELAKTFSSSVMKSSLYFTGHVYAHYCQVFAGRQEISAAIKFFHYAYYNLALTGFYNLAHIIKHDMDAEFHIMLL